MGKLFRPQTARVPSSSSTQQSINSARIANRTIDSETKQKVGFGIEGYYVPKNGLPPKAPIYTVPKDKLSNFLQQVQKRGKALPAPNAYQKPMVW